MHTTTSQLTVHPQQGTLSLALSGGCSAVPHHVLTRTGGRGSGGPEEAEEIDACTHHISVQPARPINNKLENPGRDVTLL